jgi:hypothetical protein
MTFRSFLPLITAAAILPTGSLHAATAIYSFTGKDASGSLKGVPFTAKSFSITSTASTSSVYHLPDSGLYSDIQSVNVQPVIELITDIGSFKLTLPVSDSFSPSIQSANYDGKSPFYSLILSAPNPAAVETVSKLLDIDPKLFAKDQSLFSTVASFFSKDKALAIPQFAEKYPDLYLKLSTLAEKEPDLFAQIVKTFNEYPGSPAAALGKVSELLGIDPVLFEKDTSLSSTVASFFSKDPNLKNSEFAEKYPDLFQKLSTLAEKDPDLFEQILKTLEDYPDSLISTLELASSSAELNDLRSPGEFNGVWTDQSSLSTETSMGDLSLSFAGSSFEAHFAVEIFDGPSDPSAVPEPATATSPLLLSLAGLSLISRRNRKA